MKSRGFPVTSLPCNNTVAEVWNTNLKVGMMTVMVIPNNSLLLAVRTKTIKVQALCMIEAPMRKQDSGLLFKTFFTSVISNIFGVTRWNKLVEPLVNFSQFCQHHLTSYMIPMIN